MQANENKNPLKESSESSLEHQPTPERAKKRIQLITISSPVIKNEGKVNPLKESNVKTDLEHKATPEKAKKRIQLITLSSPANKNS